LRASAARPAPDTYPITSATAPKLEALTGGAAQPEAFHGLHRLHEVIADGSPREAYSEEASFAFPVETSPRESEQIHAVPSRSARPVYQPSLFRDSSPKVVPIPVMPSARPQTPVSPQRSAKNHNKTRAKSRTAAENQQQLDLQEFHAGGLGQGSYSASAYGSAAFGLNGPAASTQIAAVIFCDSPVALPAHRMIAGLVDGGIVLASVLGFLAIFHFLAIGIVSSGVLDSFPALNNGASASANALRGVGIGLDLRSVLIGLGAAIALTILYRFFWGLLESDTPGMRFAGLKLVNFDGRAPSRRERLNRQAAYIVSLFSAGLGFVWVFLDEESLTWHDHISNTFPTPIDIAEHD
jgi:uncharacterized RDD family membrane protein YckC